MYLTYLFLLLTTMAIIGYIVGKPYWQEYQRRGVRARPFKKQWRQILQKRVPYFRYMPTDLQLQLKGHIQVFLDEKEFVGCEGVVITDEIKVTIAAQACLLILNRKTDYYPKLQTILVYPDNFIKRHQTQQPGGVVKDKTSVLAGESWEFGRVVLSWNESKRGADIPNDGQNVVIHEFAHQLDQETGVANGAPILQKDQSYKQWSQAFMAEYQLLLQQVQRGEESLFDYYGATNPAEFFAVASEVFFEQAALMHQYYPKLYQQFIQYYKVDPVHWQ